jgi:hypothetical protein
MSHQYLLRKRAAEYLGERGIPTTAQALADQASRGAGPKYSIVRGRAVYTAEDLDSWLAAQIARPVIRRSRQRPSVAAA